MKTKFDDKIFRGLILLMMAALTGIPAIQKIVEIKVPDWFLRKFEDSIFNLFPLELEFAYYFIVFIETLVFILFLFTFFRKDFIFDGETTLTHYAFFLSFFLFFVLFVGSFLVKDYENGLNDFVFFCGSAYLFSLYKKSFISISNK